MKQITIQGMHCTACKQLINMELEDAGLSSLIESFSDPKDNQGQLMLKEEITEEEVQKIKQVINTMDDYFVEEIL